MARFSRAALAGLAAALVLAPNAAAALPDTPGPGSLYQDGHTGRLLLGGPWLLRLDPDDRGAAAGFATDDSTDGWFPIQVPYAWNATTLTPASQEGGVAWYRRDFELDASPASRWRFRFESVNLRAQVYLNGALVGTHTGAFLPFEVPGDRLRRGQNRLVVRVDNRRLPTDLPPFELSDTGKPGGGWWNDGGILREVYLRRLARLDVTSIAVRGRPEGEVSVRARLVNTTQAAIRANPTVRIGSRRLPLGPVSLPAGGGAGLTARTTLSDPRAWSPAHPFLYPVSVLDGRRAIYRLHAGLRRWEVRAGLLYLNGRRIRLFGASMHEDEPGAGFAVSPRRRQADVAALERLGADLTRAHYPLHPRTMELLDGAGIAVWSQVPAYRYSNAALESAKVRQQALDYLSDQIRRDRNHASILAFSAGNELSARPGRGARSYVAAAAARIRRTGGGALAALDISAYPTVGKKDLYESSLDALGINEYFGWYLGPRRITADRAILGPYLDRARADYPELALFVSEFGAEAGGVGPVTQKGSYAFQADFLRYHLGEILRRRFVNGAAIWLLRDFRTRPDFTGGNPTPAPPFNQKGLLAYDGRPKPAFEAMRAMIRGASRR